MLTRCLGAHVTLITVATGGKREARERELCADGPSCKVAQVYDASEWRELHQELDPDLRPVLQWWSRARNHRGMRLPVCHWPQKDCLKSLGLCELKKECSRERGKNQPLEKKIGKLSSLKLSETQFLRLVMGLLEQDTLVSQKLFSRAELQQLAVGAPMERVAVDIMGPFPRTDKGNRYVLAAMDYFTKWPEAFAIPDQEAETVADTLVEGMFSRFGVAEVLHSDQGRNFESAVFSAMCERMGMQKTRTTPLHPQSDGLVERFNRTLAKQLAIVTAEHQRDWDMHLPLVLLGIQIFSPGVYLLHTCSSHAGPRAAHPSRNVLWQTPDTLQLHLAQNMPGGSRTGLRQLTLLHVTNCRRQGYDRKGTMT
ncbi:hypothetical protein WMY93_017440 [Mugilogobius chulae]|uniref:Integrase catalytic domain-containing protein n=1 Tax=Mugilogobius chulae TaxID=88201 RepID=A0AAW0NQZ2_9GOBI